jgi:hypothetical protein
VFCGTTFHIGHSTTAAVLAIVFLSFQDDVGSRKDVIGH